MRDHGVFADLNLYPKDIETMVSLKDQVRKVVEAMPL